MHESYYKRPLLWLLILYIICLSFFYQPHPSKQDVFHFIPQKEVTLVGKVVGFPAVKKKSHNVVLKVSRVNNERASGYVYARFTDKVPQWHETLEVSGKLKQPYSVALLGNFDWAAYLATKNVFAEIKVKESNESLDSDASSSDISLGNNRGLNDQDKVYFDLELHPKYYLKTGLNMNNYLKINGNLDPTNFMNNLANKISSEFGDKIKIDVNKEKAKFNVTFENQEEEEGEQNEEEQKLEEELDKLGLEDIDEIEEEIEKKESVIQIKLFESVNGGYLVRFAKKGGEIEDYHKNIIPPS